MSNEDGRNSNFGRDIKIVFIGNISPGTTSRNEKYIHNKFDINCKATIAPDFSYKTVKKGDILYRIQLWDIPGQDRNPSLTRIFLTNAKGVIFCCEVKNKQSRYDILKWKKSFEDFFELEEMPMIIMENKCDLLGKEENYNDEFEELKNFGDNNNFTGVFRTSALNGYTIEKAIEFLLNESIKCFDEYDELERSDLESYRIKAHPNINKANRCC